MGRVGDYRVKFVSLWDKDKKSLCSVCKDIPFGDALQGTRNTSLSKYLTDLDHIIEMKGTCPCCELLMACLQRPENDLFAPDHIKQHLGTSKQLKGFKSSNEWLSSYEKRNLLSGFGGDDDWPFGSTRDPEEVVKAEMTAERLFTSAEEQDIHGNALRNLMSDQHALGDALHALGTASDVMNVARPGWGGRQLAGAKLGVSQATAITSRAKTRLPCCVIIRLYGQDEGKIGAVSVRVYACGRAPLASLQEVCHFTLRARDSVKIRSKDGQLWYGRTLQPEVDFQLLQMCLRTCQSELSHQNTCGNRRQMIRDQPSRHWVFRVVDVENANVIEPDFRHFTQNNARFAYVALSYVWGHANPTPNEAVLSEGTRTAMMEEGSLTRMRLAATIRDAMQVTKKMGQRYLWVDKLCVMQNPSTRDLKREYIHTIENMGRIYNNALFTIVDGNSDASTKGLLRKESDRDTSGQIIAEVRPGLSLFLPTAMPNDLTRWESRAWTFQEKVLSRRMLVFLNGFAQWQCQEGIWREDVNARDVNTAPAAISHSYLRPVTTPVEASTEETYGLRTDETDGSVRLYRSPGLSQYTRCVHDYSMRTTSDSGDILRACKGILSILGSPDLLDTTFLHGLPRRFMDMALLWQVQYGIRRRKTVHGAPPSWSWAGWESASNWRGTQRLLGDSGNEQSVGPGAFYRAPFDVFFDREGIEMHLNAEGEERLRPLASIFSMPNANIPLPQLGLLGAPWMKTPPQADGPLQGMHLAFQKWEYNRMQQLPSSKFLDFGDQGPGGTPLDDKHLIICTEQAELYLGFDFAKVRRYAPDTESKHPDVEADTGHAVDPSTRDRWLFSDKTQQKPVGVANHSVRQPERGSRVGVQAIILSEAQYLGNETRPDVMGYPLYNIMLIEQVEKGSGIMERVGLGKVYKTAWTQAHPESRTVVLG